MFNKVLIANRGEIACRVIRTLKKMGIASVAVYSQADKGALHVSLADEAVCIGPAPAAESYLCAERILEAARATGTQAIHPGYGFLSENPDFAEDCAAAGIVFIGPSPAQMRAFGLKHSARELALAHQVPLLPGSGLLGDVGQAQAEAARIGYPVMLKSTAGGGGIGMRLCWSADELTEAFHAVERLARANFKESGIYLEKYVEHARHIEVQLFGDGQGRVVALGERDCSVQRRNQKVIEETPAPGLTDAQRARLLATAVRLGEAVGYTSAGTVEFVYDTLSGEFYFLEVNTRLQVEHGVTEEVTGIDLVEWMIRAAAGESPLTGPLPEPRGASIQVRLYAEDPAKDFQPSAGLLTAAEFPPDIRVDTWVERGSEVPAYYDPLLAKLIVKGEDRAEALARLQAALEATSVAGIETNLDYLRQIVRDAVFIEGRQITRYLNGFHYRPHTIDVLEPGVQSSIQDWPGRLGYWDIGVPPSGPMDALSQRVGNRLVGNPEGAPALELTMAGPTLRFNCEAIVAITGAAMPATLDGEPLAPWTAHRVPAGAVLRLGAIKEGGARAYLCVQGGFDVPDYLGSRATFTLGQFGGHAGRTLRVGDVLHIRPPVDDAPPGRTLAQDLRPVFGRHWDIGVLYGPHGAPDFFTDADIATLFATDWEVHYNSSRTGVRLIGPKPEWARTDGGEAGLHPSNIHDNAYAIGSIDFTGDMPVILGPDGPSLGGFVCPAVVVQAELWKLGQLRPGDTLRFHRLTQAEAAARAQALDAALASLDAPLMLPVADNPTGDALTAILHRRPAGPGGVDVAYRRAGDAYLLIEYGELKLDLALRMRAHALMEWVQAHREGLFAGGIIDLTPGIRSLQIHYDPRALPLDALLAALLRAEEELPEIADLTVPSRIVHLPLAWDDSQTRLAIEKYMQSVRPDAPWCPSNIEFIRRINGLDSIDEVRRVVFEASYMVLGLGDVYLGAPVATPVDPRHRLVTTKYNPARTWTPENTVGIGGAYLCVYGMESPGGYQLVGRTLQIWNRYKQTADFREGKPWLLRFFDQIRFYPVTEEELLKMREDFPLGRLRLRVEESRFSLGDYQAFLEANAEGIAAFKQRQQAAFEAERERWKALGQAEYTSDAMLAGASPESELDLPEHSRAVGSPVSGNVWKVKVAEGDRVKAGDVLVIVESMKMEIHIEAPCNGQVFKLFCREATPVTAGQDLLILQEEV